MIYQSLNCKLVLFLPFSPIDDRAHAKVAQGRCPRRQWAVGNKRVLAFFEQSNGHCALQAVIWNTADVNADTTSRFCTDLSPRQVVSIETPDNKSLQLQCGVNADRLAIVENKDFVAASAGN